MGRATKTSWQPGTSGNPAGRPKRETERDYLDVVMRLCPLKSWAQVVERAVVDAQQGDRHARDWLSRYLLPLDSEQPASSPDSMPSIYYVTERPDVEA